MEKLIEQFREKINLMISKTPTSEIINEITEINIIFEKINIEREQNNLKILNAIQKIKDIK